MGATPRRRGRSGGRSWRIRRTRGRGLAVALVALVALGASGCKRRKPEPVVFVALGGAHGCAVLRSGALACWGDGAHGELGPLTHDARSAPVRVPLKAFGADSPRALALGARHSCGLSSAGDVVCWGEGVRGQLGDGHGASRDVPQRVGLTGARLVASGANHVCAALGTGARCWGANEHGELGIPSGPDAKSPVTPALGERTIRALALGAGHTCFALAAEPARDLASEVLCFGDDARGQSAGHAPILRGVEVVDLAAGERHTCALASSGAVQCWGGGDRGQLGDGSTTDSRVPVPVATVVGAAHVRAGAEHTCVRLRNNTVSCWGDNRAQQLARATRDVSPAPVFGLLGVAALAAGGDGSCAVLADGEPRCWGKNDAKQIGSAAEVLNVPMPLRIPPP